MLINDADVWDDIIYIYIYIYIYSLLSFSLFSFCLSLSLSPPPFFFSLSQYGGKVASIRRSGWEKTTH